MFNRIQTPQVHETQLSAQSQASAILADFFNRIQTPQSIDTVQSQTSSIESIPFSQIQIPLVQSHASSSTIPISKRKSNLATQCENIPKSIFDCITPAVEPQHENIEGSDIGDDVKLLSAVSSSDYEL